MHGERPINLPMIPSHEPAGVVHKIGPNTDCCFQIGDRVGVLNFMNACKECPDCLAWHRKHGKFDARFCPGRKTAGFKDNGGFAEFMLADPLALIQLPGALGFNEAAPLMCAGVSL
jgi:D-arabinose 1-dehydrogenase-like Zn-dependent alcohol dehydrogenase